MNGHLLGVALRWRSLGLRAYLLFHEIFSLRHILQTYCVIIMQTDCKTGEIWRDQRKLKKS